MNDIVAYHDMHETAVDGLPGKPGIYKTAGSPSGVSFFRRFDGSAWSSVFCSPGEAVDAECTVCNPPKFWKEIEAS
jgi:hypothetical protein